jgi:serine/threonine-protein kinase
MVTTELGACEWFVWDLRRSNLIDRGRLDQVISEFIQQHPRAEPATLAEYLVTKEILSPFQAERILQGKTQGFVLGPFTLVDVLGAGSMGTVYKAKSKNDSNWYAVKVLPRRSMWNVRIARRKVRSFEQCQHPAVVPFVDVGTAGGMHYLAWPYVEGQPLDKVVAEQGQLPPGFAAQIALQIAEGLEVCHHQGLFHGLLKPSNILVTGDPQVFILDFGIGTLLAETEGESLVDTMSTANAVTSGLDCSSPESIMDPTNLTPAGDQYSLGCLLYFCLTGRFPFPDGSAAEKMMAHQFNQPTPVAELNPAVPAALIEVVNRLMQKAPEARYGGVAEVVEILRTLADPVVPAAPAPAPAVRSSRPATMAGDFSIGRPRDPAPAPMPARQPQRPATMPAVFTPRHAAPTQTNIDLSAPARPAARVLRPVSAPKLPAPVPQPAAAHAPTPAPAPEERVVPGAQFAEKPEYLTWEERLGPVGIAVGAFALCIAAWFAASHFLLK